LIVTKPPNLKPLYYPGDPASGARFALNLRSNAPMESDVRTFRDTRISQALREGDHVGTTGPDRPAQPLDLSNVNLRGADLRRATVPT
jgi:hypothetical protein